MVGINVIPQDIVIQALRLQRKAFLVKFVTIIDFVSNIIYGFYGYFMYVIFAACSAAGYMSTVTYNRSLLIYYLAYQSMLIMFKVSNFILFIILASSSNLRDYVDDNFENNTIIDVNNLDYKTLIPVSGLLVIVQGFITYYVYQFYKLLPTRNEVHQLLI